MKKSMLLVVIGLSLTACSTDTTAQAVQSVAITGDSTIVLGETKPLTATLKDSNGNVLTGRTITWSSSDPNLVSVDSNGHIIANHFSRADGKSQVTITATSEGKSASFNVMPYGFDIACGTFVSSANPGKVREAIAVRFRNAAGAGVTANSSYTLTGPAGFNDGKPYSGGVFASASGGLKWDEADPITGTYTATFVDNGTTYTNTCTIDTTKVMGFVVNPQFSLNGKALTISGTADTRANLVYGGIENANSRLTAAPVVPNPAFSTTGNLNATPTKGTYSGFIWSSTDLSPVLPEEIMISQTDVGGSIVIP